MLSNVKYYEFNFISTLSVYWCSYPLAFYVKGQVYIGNGNYDIGGSNVYKKNPEQKKKNQAVSIKQRQIVPGVIARQQLSISQ